MSLITVFDPWQSKLCTCPPKYSLSPYTGCGHGCIYCYASSYIVNFSSPRPKKDFARRLEKEIKKIPGGSLITIANSSDPYLSLEEKLNLTRQALNLMQHYDLRILLVTKSPLILKDLEVLKRLKKVVVSFTLTTLREKLAEKLEPSTPSPGQRLRAIKSLSPHLPVVCRFDPLIYPLNTGEIKEMIKELRKSGVKQIITSTYKAKPDNFNRLTSAFPKYKSLWEKLYLHQGGKISRYLYLPEEMREELIQAVRDTTLQQRLDFSSCREGFTQLNTKNCDGSSFF